MEANLQGVAAGAYQAPAVVVYHPVMVDNIRVYIPDGYSQGRPLNVNVSGDVDTAQGFVL